MQNSKDLLTCYVCNTSFDSTKSNFECIEFMNFEERHKVRLCNDCFFLYDYMCPLCFIVRDEESITISNNIKMHKMMLNMKI